MLSNVILMTLGGNEFGSVGYSDTLASYISKPKSNSEFKRKQNRLANLQTTNWD